MEFLILLIPLLFIGAFLAAPFWISLVTKSEHKTVLNEAKKYSGIKREEFLESKREEKRSEKYSKSISGGITLIVLAALGLLTGNFSVRSGSDGISRGDGDERFFFFVGLSALLGVTSLIYGLLGKRKIKILNTTHK